MLFWIQLKRIFQENGVFEVITIVTRIVTNMKYLCRTCKVSCDDIIIHLIKVHKFSKKTIKSQLETNPYSFKSSFEEIP